MERAGLKEIVVRRVMMLMVHVLATVIVIVMMLMMTMIYNETVIHKVSGAGDFVLYFHTICFLCEQINMK